MDLDIWKTYRDHIVAAVDYEMVAQIEGLGFAVEVVTDDAWGVLKPERVKKAATGEFDDYHTNAEAYALLMSMEASGVAKVYDIGDSVEGRDIWAIRISDNPAVDEDDIEQSVLLVGCHHAREWISVEVSLYIAKYLTDNYATNPEIASLVDNQQIWIVPILNPDGYEYSLINNISWRKNRRDNGDGTIGVDLNRNYGYEWGHDYGSSGDTSSSTYRGPAAFSEPETRALRDLCLAHEFRSMITYHSYGGEVAYSWGYTFDSPPDRCRDRHMADIMRDLMNDVHGADYTSEPFLYPCSGDTTDWTYGNFRIPSFTIELRPTRISGDGGFNLPLEEILPTCEENLPAALYLIGWNEADLNGDYIVNLNDLAVLASHWLTSGGCDLGNICCEGADIFGSDTVDVKDLAILAEKWVYIILDDTSAPSPDPMSFSSAPSASGDSSITMTATKATDFSKVQYYFTCTGDGDHDSEWQDSRTYEDSGLTPSTQYTYTVIARDKSYNRNQTAASGPVSATTNPPDTTIPTPNTMTWSIAPNARSSSVISMTATTASDTSGVEYFFDCTTAGIHDSGWQDSSFYADTGLSPNSSYTYTVTVRDKSTNQNITAPSTALSATTLTSPSGPWIGTEKDVHAQNEDITVYFANTAGNVDDWIGFFEDGAANGSYLIYIYLEGEINGTVTYGGFSDPGDYDIRLFFNDSYTLEASCDITVE
jgi:chitodextrinase